ncbi:MULTISPECIES: TetR/AcrR family transcriptional regulator [unclassified Rhizobium]|uniref:TetR/AcrR family transcriptional regulator n=1 Tax=unclassified Rhizobium TaxID=2613769 RepID=UPI000EA93B03|nr:MULTISPECIES: TetR/AcrR family transcriptional regulator [unclassified Rhizobium]AYG68455.1 TetR/AcrR family transcriptional regulator [Rhizobium sp. CCGE531]AYG74838.1 TetR/AcrR family transcriptional regulator [Rhizobium sp. CCGE532]
MKDSPQPTRDRILQSAGKLFHQDGIRAISVDAIAEKAGVTKRTLYYHFRSKDDLIAAHLQARDEPNLVLFKRWFEETDGDIAEKVAGIFRRLAQSAQSAKWKGCGFLRTSVELINLPGHPALVVARAHKKRVEDWLGSVFAEAGAGSDALPLARQIMLLLDGSFAVVLLHRDPSYMETAADAVAGLIRGGLAAPGRLAPIASNSKLLD